MKCSSAAAVLAPTNSRKPIFRSSTTSSICKWTRRARSKRRAGVISRARRRATNCPKRCAWKKDLTPDVIDGLRKLGSSGFHRRSLVLRQRQNHRSGSGERLLDGRGRSAAGGLRARLLSNIAIGSQSSCPAETFPLLSAAMSSLGQAIASSASESSIWDAASSSTHVAFGKLSQSKS